VRKHSLSEPVKQGGGAIQLLQRMLVEHNDIAYNVASSITGESAC
jgi:hypothetical protein